MIDHKCYIGQSVNIEDRWINHKTTSRNINHKNSNYPIYRAIRKYGLENFKFSIVEKCSKEELNEKEKYWISYFNSFNNGYNQTLGGQSTEAHGTKLTQEQINEIYDLLKNTKILINDIAIQYNVNPSTITRINRGKFWNKKNFEYPIRKKIDKKTKIIKNNKINKISKKCAVCGKVLSTENSTLCKECYIKSIQSPMPSREELKNKIRELNSFKEVALYYDKIGDSLIKTWCKKYNLPTRKKEIDSYSNEEWQNI